MKKEYTTKEVAKILQVSDRSVRRYLSDYISFNGNTLSVSKKMLEVLKNESYGQGTDKARTGADTSEVKDTSEIDYDIVEGFSNEEYQEFQKRLIEYPILNKDLEYHRKSAESHQRQMELILRNLEQRNFIEAKDKNLE